MEISVLLCTYNRPEKLLHAALKSIVFDAFNKPDELIIVNGGDERADRIIRNFMEQGVNIMLVNTINKNLAASRNIGLAYCSKDIIAMTDDDAQVFPDWICQMKKAHREHPEAGAVGGVVLGTNNNTLVGRVADLVTFPNWDEPRYVRTLPGVNISYKKELIDQIGFQDEALFRGEDVDFNWRIKKLGYEIYFDPQIKVYHHHRPTLRGFLKQHFMYGRSYYLVRRKWPDMYCIYPHQISQGRDLLKAAHFVLAPFYEPFVISGRLESITQRLCGIPIIFAAGLAWRAGMVVQAVKERIFIKRLSAE